MQLQIIYNLKSQILNLESKNPKSKIQNLKSHGSGWNRTSNALSYCFTDSYSYQYENRPKVENLVGRRGIEPRSIRLKGGCKTILPTTHTQCWRELNPQITWVKTKRLKPFAYSTKNLILKIWHRNWDLNSECWFWRPECCQLHHPCLRYKFKETGLFT
jgi:hypothetical protein